MKGIPHHPFLGAFSTLLLQAQIQSWTMRTLKLEILAIGFELFSKRSPLHSDTYSWLGQAVNPGCVSLVYLCSLQRATAEGRSEAFGRFQFLILARASRLLHEGVGFGFFVFENFLFQYLLKNKSKPLLANILVALILHSEMLFVRLFKDINSIIIECFCICMTGSVFSQSLVFPLMVLFQCGGINVLRSFQIKTLACQILQLITSVGLRHNLY